MIENTVRQVIADEKPPDNVAAALYLHKVENRSAHEIADELNVPLDEAEAALQIALDEYW